MDQYWDTIVDFAWGGFFLACVLLILAIGAGLV
jgi:hypothetical protein